MLGLVQSTGSAALGTRSGQANPKARGIIIVGGLACTMVDPSMNSTIECTTLLGCTTTSMRSMGMPKRRFASITSSPLLTKVAELMVITGPIDQVGWLRASATLTWASSSFDLPLKGPPLAVRMRRRTSAAEPPRKHCATALCSESTAMICPGR